MTSSWKVRVVYLVAALACVLGDRSSIGQKYHDDAIRMANSGQLEESLYLFRAACRANPDDPLFQNDLGVTEMRLGKYDLAQQRFLTANDLDADLQVLDCICFSLVSSSSAVA